MQSSLRSDALSRPAREIPVWDSFDVAVAGGGFAGAAAALAAARNGARACLIEKAFGLGGLGTLGHVITYLPLCDGRGRQVTFGIAEELLKLPCRYSGCRPPAPWQSPDTSTPQQRAAERYRMDYDPAPMSIGMERLLEDAGVEIIYDTLVVGVEKDAAGAITHLVAENKSGAGAFAVKAVVDATGDADICHLAGEKTYTARENVRSAWYYQIDPERRVSIATAVDNFYAPMRGGADAAGIQCFDGADYRSVTRQVIESRKLILEKVATENKRRAAAGLAGEVHAFYAPYFHGFRMTRRLVSDYELSPADLHKWHPDAVGIFSDWRKSGPVYSLPFRALATVNTPNLAAAGRCISSAGDLWDITRVIPVCSASGEAAGIAAALSALSNKAMRALPIEQLQSRLRAAGVQLSPKLVAEEA